MNHKRHLLLLTLLFIIFAPGIYFSSGDPEPAEAQVSTIELTGWAWSSNVGWISFSSKNTEITGDSASYGVKFVGDLNTTGGYLYGYAWNPVVGYIDFGPNSASRTISQTPKPTTLGNGSLWSRIIKNGSSYSLKGWARACSVYVSGCSGPLKPDNQRGGWDGWISFYGIRGAGGAYEKVYEIVGTKTTDGIIFNDDSYAWGGGSPVDGDSPSPQFPGWISFRPRLNISEPGPGPGPGPGGCTTNCGVIIPIGPMVSDLDAGICTINPTNPQAGDTITLTANPSGGVAPYNHKWYFGPSLLGESRSYVINNAESGTYTYSIEVTDNLNGIVTGDCKVAIKSTPEPGPAYIFDIVADDLLADFSDRTSPQTVTNLNKQEAEFKVVSTGAPCNDSINLTVKGMRYPPIYQNASVDEQYYSRASFDPVFVPIGNPTKLDFELRARILGKPALFAGDYTLVVEGRACGTSFESLIPLKIVMPTGGEIIEQ